MKKNLLLFIFTLLALQPFAQSISAGAYFSMAICRDNNPYSWGSNGSGELGDSSTIYRNLPVSVYNLTNVLDMSGGAVHTLALKSDSSVWAWGRNDYGALGVGTYDRSLIPLNVNNLSGIVAISAGNYFSAALKSDSTVWTWGHNNMGQLGTGNTTNSTIPLQVTSINGITAIAGGREYMLALKSDSTIWGWGLNDQGQLGLGYSDLNTHPNPMKANNLDSIVGISCGRYAFSVALKSDGTVWTWGNNLFGQLGNGTNTNNTTPGMVNGLTGIIALAKSSGTHHTLVVKNDGTVWAWGYNNAGQLGNGSNIDSYIPVQVSNLTDVVAVSCGDNHSIALKSDGTVWAWGNNSSGELGNGSNTNSNIPVQVTLDCETTTQIRGIENLSDIQVFPNPSTGKFQIKFDVNISMGITTEIYNLIGEKIYFTSSSVNSGYQQIDISNSPRGIYLIKINNGNKTITKKVILR